MLCFSGKRQYGVLPLCDDLRTLVSLSSSSFVNHKPSGSNFSITVRPRIPMFYRHVHIDMHYSHTGYDITSCFRSQQNAIKYCPKVCKVGAAGKESNDSATVEQKQFYTDIHVDLIYSHTGYDVISYCRSAFVGVRTNG